MKKWMYVISVGSMLAVFLFFYTTHLKEADIAEKARIEKKAREDAEIKAKKDEREAQARKDAADRAAKRDADEKEKEAQKVAAYKADVKKIQDSLDDHNAKADEYAKLISRLDIELNNLRAAKERLNRDAFDVAKQVEAARVEKRTSELEIQRVTDMIAKRAVDSSLTRPPELPKPPSS